MSTVEEDTATQFGTVDYVVVVIVLAISSAIGLYYRFTGGKQKTSKEYLLADGNMTVLPVAFSLMASFMSAVTLLGTTQENYSFGTQFVLINFAYILSTPVAALIFLPVFYNLKFPSVYKYLENRFGVYAKMTASLAFSLQMILYMGIVLYAPSLALSAVTGISFVGSVLSVGFVCTFYSTLGGMKAVLVTDVFQSVLMFACILTVIISTCIKSSISEVWATAYERGRIQFDNVSIDPTVRHTMWTQMIGGSFIYLSLYAVNQAQVQRLLTLPSLKKAQTALVVQVPILMCLALSTSFAGLCIFHTYKDCDPSKAGRIKTPDQLLPLYIVEQLSQYPGLAGLAVAGIFSGSLSTVSSAINSLAAVSLEDYIKPHFNISDKKSSLLLKILAFVYGITCVAFAFLADLIGTGVLQASLTIFGVVGGPLLGLFTLGMLTRCTEEVGAVSGVVTGLAVLAWIGFGGPKPPPPKLPVSIEGCFVANQTVTTMLSIMNQSETSMLSILDQSEASIVPSMVDQLQTSTASSLLEIEPEYFYLYRISYAWYSFIGFVTTFTVGILVSCVYTKLAGKTVLVEDKHLATFLRRSDGNGQFRENGKVHEKEIKV